jgi:hypothetical protein
VSGVGVSVPRMDSAGDRLAAVKNPRIAELGRRGQVAAASAALAVVEPEPRRIPARVTREGTRVTRRTSMKMGERTLTLVEAAEATGLTPKALQRRIDRGRLRSVLIDSRRRVPVSELLRTGLLTPDGSPSSTHAPGPWVKAGDPSRGSDPRGPAGDYTISVQELLDRIERQAEEIGEMRALTREAEPLRAQVETERRAREALEQEYHRERAELAGARARISELEASAAASPPAPTSVPRRWWTPWRCSQESSPTAS